MNVPARACRALGTRVPKRFASTKTPSSPKNRPPPPPTQRPYRPPQKQVLQQQLKQQQEQQQKQPPNPKGEETLLEIWRRSWIPLSGAAVASLLLGFYIAGTITASLKSGDSCGCGADHPATPTGRPPALTGDNAEEFDKTLNWDEWWMGITTLRKRMAKQARGHVLEVAMGTGRNLEYYDWDTLGATVAEDHNDGAKGRAIPAAVAAQRAKNAPAPGITSFTGLDISVDMLDVARKKLVKAVPPMASSAPIVKASDMTDHVGGQLSYLQGRMRLINSDVHHTLPLPQPTTTTTTSKPAAGAAQKYDTVIQTFGLCSVSDPVAVLSNLASVVKPGSGRIILLEHGKGWFGLVNGLLDRNAGKHFAKFGCWWNRDIPGVVDEAVARNPGLEIVKVHRPNVLQLGTLVWVELRVVEPPASSS